MNTSVIQTVDIQSLLGQVPAHDVCWAAYSGGADSTALLHILSQQSQQLSVPLKAIHVDHQLHPYSRQWVRHCRKQCEDLDVELQVVTVDATPPRGESPEAWARQLRYQSICDLMGENDVLFTAHHKEDQAETLLMQLIRGAGPEGLASMPEVRRMHTGWLIRPLLQFSRDQLREYNLRHRLVWIEDDSNRQTGIDRNYIRHEVVPALVSRWPGVLDTLCRSARHQAEHMEIAKEVAADDALTTISPADSKILNIPQMQALSRARQKNLLRYWIKSNQFPLPGSDLINRILVEVIAARPDALPCLQWEDSEIRRYRERLYLMQKLPDFNNGLLLEWNVKRKLQLPHGSLQAEKQQGAGIRDSQIENNVVTVGFRRGGESIQLPGRKHKRALKKLFQEAAIPVWQRDRLPLLYVSGKLAAVANQWTDQYFQAGPGETGWVISFRPD